jgi:hypothetical protein
VQKRVENICLSSSLLKPNSLVLVEVKDKKQTYIYMSYSGNFLPQEADWQTTPKLGDLYTEAEDDNIWIYRDGEWVLADKADDDNGNPVERFPSDKGHISGIMLANGKWTNRRDVTRKSMSMDYILMFY